jgi:hypothetical protein
LQFWFRRRDQALRLHFGFVQLIVESLLLVGSAFKHPIEVINLTLLLLAVSQGVRQPFCMRIKLEPNAR